MDQEPRTKKHPNRSKEQPITEFFQHWTTNTFIFHLESVQLLLSRGRSMGELQFPSR